MGEEGSGGEYYYQEAEHQREMVGTLSPRFLTPEEKSDLEEKGQIVEGWKLPKVHVRPEVRHLFDDQEATLVRDNRYQIDSAQIETIVEQWEQKPPNPDRMALGTTGFVDVIDERSGRELKGKVFHPDVLKDPKQQLMLLRIARINANLDTHPNIVRIDGLQMVELPSGELAPMIVMENLQPMKRKDAEGHPLPKERVAEIVSDVASALDYAHSQGVTHRDVKEDNILIDPNSGEAKLNDWGMVAGDYRRRNQHQQVGSEFFQGGTSVYASPEQWLNPYDITLRRSILPDADQHALGVTAWRLLNPEAKLKDVFDPPAIYSGAPFHIEYDHQKLVQTPGMSDEIYAVLGKATGKPEERYKNCSEFAEAFTNAVYASQPEAEISEPEPKELGTFNSIYEFPDTAIKVPFNGGHVKPIVEVMTDEQRERIQTYKVNRSGGRLSQTDVVPMGVLVDMCQTEENASVVLISVKNELGVRVSTFRPTPDTFNAMSEDQRRYIADLAHNAQVLSNLTPFKSATIQQNKGDLAVVIEQAYEVLARAGTTNEGKAPDTKDLMKSGRVARFVPTAEDLKREGQPMYESIYQYAKEREDDDVIIFNPAHSAALVGAMDTALLEARAGEIQWFLQNGDVDVRGAFPVDLMVEACNNPNTPDAFALIINDLKQEVKSRETYFNFYTDGIPPKEMAYYRSLVRNTDNFMRQVQDRVDGSYPAIQKYAKQINTALNRFRGELSYPPR